MRVFLVQLRLDLVDVHIKADHIVLCRDSDQILDRILVLLADGESDIKVLAPEVESLRSFGLDQFVSSIGKVLFRRKRIAVHILAGRGSDDPILIRSKGVNGIAWFVSGSVNHYRMNRAVDQIKLRSFQLCFTLDHISIRGNLVRTELRSGLVGQSAELFSKLQILLFHTESCSLRDVLMRIRLRIVRQLFLHDSYRKRLIRKRVPFRRCLFPDSVLSGLKKIAGRLPGPIVSGRDRRRHLTRVDRCFMIGVENDIKVICVDDLKDRSFEGRVTVLRSPLFCGDFPKLQVSKGRDVIQIFRIHRNILNLRLSS